MGVALLRLLLKVMVVTAGLSGSILSLRESSMIGRLPALLLDIDET